MSPEAGVRGRKISPSNNIYTGIVAFASLAVLATAAFVAYKCKSQYGTIFGTPEIKVTMPRASRAPR